MTYAADTIHLTSPDNGFDLLDADTADKIRDCGADLMVASAIQARRDGGAGIITVDGRSCYVTGDTVVYDAAEEADVDLLDMGDEALAAWVQAAGQAGDTWTANIARAILAAR